MKTLLLMDALGTGGTERQMEMLLRHWPREAGSVEVVAFEADAADRARFREVAPLRVLGRKGRADAGFYVRLARAIRDVAPDVVLAAHRFAGLLALTVPLGTRRPPVVCCIRGRHRFSGVQSLLYERLHPRWMDSRAAAVMVNAQPVVDELLTRAPGLRDRVHLVPNGVQIERFDATVDRHAWRRANGVPDDAPLMVSIGRLVDVKAPELAVDVLANEALADGGAHLAWVGDGPLRGAMQERARARGVDDRVHWLGEMDDPAPVLGVADLYVHPSHWENTSNALLEAMAARVPIVARAVGGTPELLGDGRRGHLVSGDDATSFARACAEVLADESTTARVASAREHVERNFSVQHMVDVHVDVLRSVVSAP